MGGSRTALLPHLRAARGRVAIISSQMASDARAPGGSYAYRASKAAALNLGRNLATDLRGAGIGTTEAIHVTWSHHREIIMDQGPLPDSWEIPPVA